MYYLILTGVISWVLINILRKVDIVSVWWLISAIGLCISGFLFIGMLMGIPISRNSERESLERLKAFQDTIFRARQDKALSEMERAAILAKIADWNEWLASRKYWDKGQWDYWHVDEVSTTEPLE